MDSPKQEGGYIGYELRENPKKSWKISSSNLAASCSAPAFAATLERKCNVCGKKFESLKALYGHMRHHPRKDRKTIQCNECGKSLSSAKSLCNHMRVHSKKLKDYNESEAVKGLVVKRKRSQRKRYNFNDSSSISSFNESLCVTEIDDEVFQGAVCLMMLSRGVRNWDGFSEFSDNDEVKSLNKKRRVGDCFVSNGSGCLLKKPRPERLGSTVLHEKEEEKCNEMDSGADIDDGEKVRLEVLIEKFYADGEFKKMPTLDDNPELVPIDGEIEKEPSKDLMEEEGLNEPEMGIVNSTSSKKVSFSAEFGRNVTSDNGILDGSQKKSEIMCETCNKIFCSHRQLGVHQQMRSSKRSSISVKTRNFEEQNQTTMFPEVEAGSTLENLECIENLMEKANKEHKCRICLKVFATGQALGGHQKAHRSKNSDTNLQEIAVEQDYSDVSNDLDHNILNILKEKVGGGGDGDDGSETRVC